MTRPRARRSVSPAVSTARKGVKKASSRMTTTFTVEISPATLLNDAENEHAQGTRDVREVAVALLANKRRFRV